MSMPTPHLEKLIATGNNDKLPPSDKTHIQKAIERYKQWIDNMKRATGTPEQVIDRMVQLLNEYKLFIDVDLIFDSENDFLYRQKGQLKLDNSIIEEFLPWLLSESVMPELDRRLTVGPTNCYSAIYFDSTLANNKPGAGIHVRTKDQDFALSRKLYIRASDSPDFSNAAEVNTFIAFMATEVKTNLDKTMFQEACATARDLRMAVPASRYFLMCEWLDMTPISTAPTDIEEVLILRGKRMSSNVRKDFDTSAKRRTVREAYHNHLTTNLFRTDVFKRWIDHVKSLLSNENPIEENVLEKGYF